MEVPFWGLLSAAIEQWGLKEGDIARLLSLS